MYTSCWFIIIHVAYLVEKLLLALKMGNQISDISLFVFNHPDVSLFVFNNLSWFLPTEFASRNTFDVIAMF